jgi:PKD repeat protein
MKKLNLLFAFCFLGFVLGASAQNEIPLNASKSDFRIIEKTQSGFKVAMSLAAFKTMPVATQHGNFTELLVEGFSKIYDIGHPQLPTLNKLIEVPYTANVQVNLISSKEQIIDMANYGLATKLMPCQPSVSKSANENAYPFYYDETYYQQNIYNSTPIVSFQQEGVMRGVRMGLLTVAPFKYNPVQNKLKIYTELIFEVTFLNADYALTEQMKTKYYSPVFESSLNSLINYTPPATKDMITKYPIKFVIVSLTSFQSTLQPFVKWKTKKGFTVVEQYYASAPTAATVKTYLSGLYTAGTPSNPAPSFVLIVGDVAQIPTNNSLVDVHKTDLYFCTMDGSSDYIPDMYYGRFSATTTAQLQPQIDKTLEYEQYLMPDPAYLDSCVMIAGVDDGSQPDGGYSQIWANGQINYGTTYYFNTAHGFYSNTYLWPVTNNSATDVLIRNKIGTGVSYANYTAHGSSTGWADPSFQTSNIAAMHNAHKYCLMVGNCCQTNTFNDTECFGEALLRTANKGAMGYIGASNYSYWDEDYYFGVGNRASIVEFPTYNASNLGAYDRMFHDQGQPKTSWYYTNDQMIYAGNLAVEASSSSMKQYYWEIYHLMGDPSVMTYFTVPDPLTVAYVNPQSVGVTTLLVNTEEDAYVAISHNGVLLDAELAPVGGAVTLTFPAFATPDTADIVVTKQNKVPYIGTVRFVAPSIPLDASISNIIVPAATYACEGISIDPQVTLSNMGTTVLTTVTILYHVDAAANSTYVWNGSLASLGSVNVTLPSMVLTAGSHSFVASSSLPNGGTDLNTSNDSYTKDYSVTQLTITADFSASPTSSCSAPTSVTFTNSSSNGQTYLWDFGDGNTSTDPNPVHSYTALGTYTVILTTSAGVCGSDVETKTSYITVGADAPVTADASHCGTGSVTLTATGTGNISWYDLITGGTLLTTGPSYTTPTLSSTTTYYVEQTNTPPLDYTGKSDSVGGGNMHLNNSYWLVFDCYTPVVLKSVKVYAGSIGDRIIELRNSAGVVIQSTTVSITTAGENRITLNFNLPVQNDMRLACGTANPNMYRSYGGISFPYNLAGKVSITGTNSTSTRYYYYYDWEIESPSCTSGRVPATAYILSGPPVAGFSFSPVGYNVSFTNTSTNGITYFWDFGDGSTSTQESPSHTYGGNNLYSVMLIVTNDCESDTTYQNIDLTTVSINDNLSTNMFQVYPNPANGKVTLSCGSSKIDKLELNDVTGRTIKIIENITGKISIDLAPYGAGIYYFRAFSGDQDCTVKVTNLK